MSAAQLLAQQVGSREACDALAIPRASFFRNRSPAPEPALRPASARALVPEERNAVLDVLHEPRFVDQAPAEIFATLLDEDRYLCSIRTMYRILHDTKEVRERRNLARHPNYRKPELLARGPNQVWSWDITKLRAAAKGFFFSLYVVLDIFSRYVVGWLVSDHESEANARLLVAESFRKHDVPAQQLSIHADRGSPMKAKGLAQLLADLAITKSHSRPHVSNDNPYSEAQFKTLKYRHDFPDRFGSLEDARAFLTPFFRWYNDAHHHSGIGLITPAQLHFGLADEILARRQRSLDVAFSNHPERFVRKRPTPPAIPTESWINPPKSPLEAQIYQIERNTTRTLDHHDENSIEDDPRVIPDRPPLDSRQNTLITQPKVQ